MKNRPRNRVPSQVKHRSRVVSSSSRMMNVSRQPGRIKNIFLSDRGDRQFLKCSTFGPVLDASLIVPWRARTGKVSRPIKGEHRFNRGSALGRGCRGGERHKSRPSWFQFLERSERRSRFSPLVRCHLRWPIYLFVGFAWFSCYFLAIPTVASVFLFKMIIDINKFADLYAFVEDLKNKTNLYIDSVSFTISIKIHNRVKNLQSSYWYFRSCYVCFSYSLRRLDTYIAFTPPPMILYFRQW